MEPGRIIVATNAYPGAGGGLSRALSATSVSAWITPSHNEGDRPVSGPYNHRLAQVSTAVYNEHYTFCNEGLYWVLLGAEEYLLPTSFAGMAASREVNERVAHELARAAGEKQQPAVIFVEDYQDWSVPERLRELLPPDGSSVIQFMLHTSMSSPSNPAWQRIPADIREQFFRGLLGSDQIIFHTSRDIDHFKLHLRAWLEGEVEIMPDAIRYHNRVIQLRAIPVGISPNHLDALSALPEMQTARQRIQQLLGSENIVIASVVRMDPVKNYARLVEAMPLVLKRFPAHLQGRIILALHLIPSRQNIPLYRNYKEEGDETIRRINQQVRREVIRAYDSDDYLLGLALMTRADILAIPSLAEGMNLTGLECIYLSERDAVLVLSESVGLSQYSKGWAIEIEDPTSVEEIATGLIEALRLDPQQRATRAHMARQMVRTYTIENWLENRLRFAEEYLHLR